MYIMSFVNQPCAKLVLRMMDLPAGNTSTTAATYNSAGWSINLRQQCGWTGINMRDVLGNMYDKYEQFNIVLTSCTSALGSTSIGASTEDRICSIYMAGLNWRNQGYNTGTKVTTNQVMIGTCYYVGGTGTTVNGTISSSPCTFSASDQTADIVISLYKNSTGAVSVQGTADWNLILCFNIYGIKDDTLSHDNGRGKQSNSFLTNNYHN